MLAQLFSLAMSGVAAAGDDPQDIRRLQDLTIEELMNVPVTSVSKKETQLQRSPAAVQVITDDDIARLGVGTLAEVLRVAVGMEVARVDSHTWAISARGFNGQFSDKLLVLIDGRTIYEASFPGVFWDAQDLMLEDVDRIEVIRGPGATLWGTNAVNGVINIITRHSRETAGALVSVGVGQEDRPATGVRYGGSAGEGLTYRVYGKYFDRDGLAGESGRTSDRWSAVRTGARVDWAPQGSDSVTIQADYHASEFRVPLPAGGVNQYVDQSGGGGHVLGRWRRQLGTDSEMSVQAFYSRSTAYLSRGRVEDDMADVELQHRFAAGDRHDIVWGAGYRHRVSFFPPEARVIQWPRDRFASTLATGFVQDDIALVPGRLNAIVGSKFEHNSYSGGSLQPSARLLWTPRQAHTAWAAVSKALRAPDLFERFARLQVADTPASATSPAVKVVLVGNGAIQPEQVIAYELGYRVEPTSSLSIDAAAFYNVYSDLIDFAAAAPRFEAGPSPHLLIQRTATNVNSGHSRGVELAVQWQATRFWRLSPSYARLDAPFLGEGFEFDYAPHRAQLRSYVDLRGGVELNTFVSYVGALRTREVPAYTRLDTGVVWQMSSGVRIGVWGRNLLDARHLEARESTTPLRYARREVVANVVWQFGTR